MMEKVFRTWKCSVSLFSKRKVVAQTYSKTYSNLETENLIDSAIRNENNVFHMSPCKWRQGRIEGRGPSSGEFSDMHSVQILTSKIGNIKAWLLTIFNQASITI